MKKLLPLIVLIFCVFACQETQKKEAPTQRPNIIFIMTDDHSYQTYSAYDDRFIQTPHLDRIANEGILFTNSFVSNSICAPSRAVMLTGKHSHMNGHLDNRMRFDSSQATLPKYLQAEGYQTALIGKWHLKSQPTGFDHYEVLIGQGHYYNSVFIENGERITSDGYVTNVITDKSLSWLENRQNEEPFALFVHHKATHRNWMPDTALFNEFADYIPVPPDNFFDTYEGRQAALEQDMSIEKTMGLAWDNKILDKEGEIKSRRRDTYKRVYDRMNPAQKAAWDAFYDPIIDDFKNSELKGDELTLWKYKRYMQDYLSCVRSVDNNVGRLLDYLDEHGLAENTIVIYTSDQGFYMGEHGWFDKRFMYEESLRTPLAMRLPKSMASDLKVVDQLVQNIDYAPTILDLVGAKIPADMQGMSMKPILQDASNEWRDGIYYHYYEYPGAHSVKKHYGIRTDRYKLIHFYDDIDIWELFDLENDPDEMQNLYGQAEYEELVEELKGRLGELEEEYGVER